MDVPEFTVEDFVGSTEPYELVVNEKDQFKQEQMIALFSMKLKALDKSLNFKSLLKAYLNSTGQEIGEHYTEFTEQPIQLRLGTRYIANDSGVKAVANNEVSTVCMHPILPIARLCNVDTGEYGLELAYRHAGQQWRTIAVPREDLASASKIVNLAIHDVSVTTVNAKALCGYLNSVQEMNHNDLPERLSIGRFGWVGDNEFVPYSDKYVFEGEGKARQMYDAVHNHGSAQKWYDEIKEIRSSNNVIARIVLATSLASVLVRPCGVLPFIVHLWGRTGKGKTLALMLAASVWADPKGGKFVHTFNATAVGLERSAAFLHHLPLLLDELQTISSRSDFEDMIYQLTEGIGRTRGNKDSSLRDVGQWANAIITTGEQPITRRNSGGGTVNRVIEIDCSNIDMFDDPHEFAKVLSNNYGYLGEKFVELLCDSDVMEVTKAKQEQLRDSIYIEKPDVTEKQALAASLILTADYIATKFILRDDNEITVSDIVPFLTGQDQADKDKRAYEWLRDWVAGNANHFLEEDEDSSDFRTQIYGKWLDNGNLAVIRTAFNDAGEDAGYGATSLARYLKDNGFSECDKDRPSRYDKVVRFDEMNCRCIVLKSDDQVNFENLMDSEEIELVSESEAVPW